MSDDKQNSTSGYMDLIEIKENEKILYKVYSNRRLKFPESFSGRASMLMVSMRSRSFPREIIEKAFNFSKAHSLISCYTIVDLPYAHNAFANVDSLEELIDELNKLISIRGQVERKIKKVIRKNGFEVEYIAWQDVISEVPIVFQQEVLNAVSNSKEFRESILSQVSLVIPNFYNIPNRENFVMFFISELPCLLYLYTKYKGGVIDLYPGPNPDIIWQISNGHYVEFMPTITKSFADGNQFIYVELC